MLAYDVVVVGAGPAGSAAALTLARGGRRVALVDKARFPRDKCCGDGLTALALRELEALGLDPGAVPSWTPVHEAVVRSPGGHVVTLPLPTGHGLHAAVARRSELDAALVELARSGGVEVLEKAAVTAADEGPDGVRIGLADGRDLAAGWAVGADGMWSPLRKLLAAGTDGYLGEWHAARQYLRVRGGEGADRLWVWFDADLLPGYAWSFPLGDGVVNAGFGLLRGGPAATREMGRRWPELLQRDHVRRVLGDVEPEGPLRAWPIPARLDRVALTTARALFVGDAAAATDPMTGEGIGQALETGRLAAEAILAGGSAADIAGRYERSVAHHLVADHRLARLLGRTLTRRRVAEAAVRITGASDWSRRNFARWLFEDYPRAVLGTPRRWRRGLLAPPGAYEH